MVADVNKGRLLKNDGSRFARITLLVIGTVIASVLAVTTTSLALDTVLASSVVLPPTHGRHSGAAAVYDLGGTGSLDVSATLVTENELPLTPAQREREIPLTFTLDPSGSLKPVDPSRTYALALFEGPPSDAVLLSNTSIKSGDTFMLRHGQHALISGIEKGALYRLSDEPLAGYASKSTNSQGHVLLDSTAVSFTKTAVESQLSSLTVTKAVEGALGETDRDFEFTLTLDTSEVPDFRPTTLPCSRFDSVDPRPEEGGGVAESVPATALSTTLYTATFYLKASESLIFDQLPLKLAYTLNETPVADYTHSVFEAHGTICNPTGTTIPVVNHAGTVPNDKWTIDLTTKLHDLSADKSADKTKEFEFTFSVSTPDKSVGYQTGSISYIIEHSDGTKTNDVIDKTVGMVTERIKLGDRFHITGTSVDNVTYTLKETGSAPDRYVGSLKELKGTVRSGQTIAIDWDVLYDPYRETRPVTIEITKALEGPAPCLLYPSVFEIAFDKEMPIRFTLTAGESITFDTTQGTRYRIREIVDPDAGYALQRVVNGEGSASGDVLIEGVSFTERYLLMITTSIAGQVSFDVRGMDVALPATVKVSLVDTRTGAIKAHDTTSADKEWMFAFKDVLKYDTAGAVIPYTVTAQQIEGYTSEVKATGNDYFTLVETYIPPVIVNTPYVTKAVSPTDAPVKNFTFALKPKGLAPLPFASIQGQATATVAGTGSANFGMITLSKEGTYEYLISEVTGSDASYSADADVYALTYQVALKDTGKGPALIPTATLAKVGEGAPVTSIASKSTYTPPPSTSAQSSTQNNPPKAQSDTTQSKASTGTLKTGDISNPAFWAILAVIAVGSVVFACQFDFYRRAKTERR